MNHADERPPRSYLYAPGHRPELVGKALAGEADAVIADLEDGVPGSAKDAARAAVAEIVAERYRPTLHVRVNPVCTDTGRADLEAMAAAKAAVVHLPKVADPGEARRAVDILGAAVDVVCLLETARGIEAAYEIASAHPRIVGIALGEADLGADLGLSGAEADAGLAFARGRCVVAARAAGLRRPVQSVYPHLGDPDGLAETSRRGRALGFFGRSAIHPAQVPIINKAYLPSAEELEAARALVAALPEGDGSAVLDDGRFVDPAVVQRARWTLAWDPTLEAHP